MPDITMCDGHGCPRRASCYRHTAKENPYWQPRYSVPPFKADGTCDRYWPAEPAKKEKAP